MIKEKITMIETLLDIEIATKILSINNTSGIMTSDSQDSFLAFDDPIDAYHKLKTDIKVLPKDTAIYGMIERYINNTQYNNELY